MSKCDQILLTKNPSKTNTIYHSREEPQCLEVLQYVARLCSDQKHVELFHGLIHVPHALSLNEGMLLRARAYKLGKRR